MRIRGAVLPATGAPLEVTELDLAAPGPGEVLVRLEASGVCHSDLNAIDGTAETRCPAVLGHEGAGVVEAVGPDVSLRPGTRVALSWLPWCGACEECLRDLPHLCRTAWSAMGHGGLLDGTPRLSRNGLPVYHYSLLSTFADHAVVGRALVHPDPGRRPRRRRLARRLRDRDRGRRRLADSGRAPGGPGLRHRLRRRRPLGAPGRDRRRSRARRRRRRRRAKLAEAASLGATATVAWTGDAESTAERVREASGGGVDYALEATGRPEAALAAFLACRARGAAVLIGIPRADAVVTLPALQIPRSERRVLGSIYGSSKPERDFPAILELYRSGRLPLDRLISHRLPLEAVAEAFELMQSGTALRVVLELDRKDHDG